MKKRVYKNLVLPSSLSADLEECTKGVQLRNCYRILDKVSYADNKREHQSNCSFTPIPQSYFTSTIGQRYNEPLNVLLDNQIVERTDTFGPNQCFEYRINTTYIDDPESIKVKYWYNIDTESEWYINAQKETVPFINNFDRLHIPFSKLFETVDQHVSCISLDDYTYGEEIDWTCYRKVHDLSEDWVFNPLGNLTQKDAILWAEMKEKIVVEHGKKLVMVDEDYFIEEQKQFSMLSWHTQLANLESHDTLYANRNSTNNRLDTNFTNLAKPLWEVILKDNDMGEADLMNSQPALLAHILEKQGIVGIDIKKFQELAYSGNFYEHFGDDRQKFKRILFKVLFGPQSNKLLTEEFPNVANFIKMYKKENGYRAFPIMLQKLESKIFIDGIYYSLLSQDIPVFTKHDSIAFWSGDQHKVYSTIQDVFNTYNFKGRIKLEYP